ncbi:MAG: tetratricopeptide repeat protein, partial [Lachnospiraceae bacterium]|nr:tetratricopeptide repeat protein [Lachnospiraceae bacterium]
MAAFLKKTAAFLLAAILTGSCVPGCAKVSDESGKSYRAALEKYDAGFYDEAVALFLRAESQGDRTAWLKADLALAYLKSGDMKKAEETLLKALSEANGEKAVFYRAGLYYREKGDFESAETYLRSSLPDDPEKVKPEELPAYGYLAEAKMMLGKSDEAISIFKILIQNDYHPTEHKLLIGECYLKAKQVSAACTYFDWAEEAGL